MELFALVRSAEAARLMFETLETGVDGVLLHTESALEVKSLFAYIQSRFATGTTEREREREGVVPLCMHLSTLLSRSFSLTLTLTLTHR